jgi:hypothetical protein
MAQTPIILGQNLPDANIDTNLFTVSVGQQVQFSIFVANQSETLDRITIALIPDSGPETPANYIAYQTPILGNAVMAFSGLFMNASDRVLIRSLNGTTSFTATGVITE